MYGFGAGDLRRLDSQIAQALTHKTVGVLVAPGRKGLVQVRIILGLRLGQQGQVVAVFSGKCRTR